MMIWPTRARGPGTTWKITVTWDRSSLNRSSGVDRGVEIAGVPVGREDARAVHADGARPCRARPTRRSSSPVDSLPGRRRARRSPRRPPSSGPRLHPIRPPEAGRRRRAPPTRPGRSRVLALAGSRAGSRTSSATTSSRSGSPGRVLTRDGRSSSPLNLHRDHGGRGPRLDVVDDALGVAVTLAAIAHAGVAVALAPQVVLDLLGPRLEGVRAGPALAHEARHLGAAAPGQVHSVHPQAHEGSRGRLEHEVELGGARGVGLLRLDARPPVARRDQALPHLLRRGLGLGATDRRRHGPDARARRGRAPRERPRCSRNGDGRAGRRRRRTRGRAPAGTRLGPGRDPGFQVPVGHEAGESAPSRGLDPRGPEGLAHAESGGAAQALGGDPPVALDLHVRHPGRERRSEDEGHAAFRPLRLDLHVLEVAGGEEAQHGLSHPLGIVGVAGVQAEGARVARRLGGGELDRPHACRASRGPRRRGRARPAAPSAISAGARRTRSLRGRSG